MQADVVFRVRCDVDDEVLSDLHNRAFAVATTSVRRWSRQLERNSLTWVCAFVEDAVVGFVNIAWDGGGHAFVLDTTVHPDYQGRRIGRQLVHIAAAEAKRAGCQWLHVDYEPHLRSFYRDSCGFRPTTAGLLDLNGATEPVAGRQAISDG
ncbi:GNAT family N-acetyltransferase [Pengzhenrongella frigida]|uniref:N-acetyltransferase n=1 Tax=Pengzhenrongella frigida TaxID=1259133 RepID=A0A4Q5N3L9_9MICO|nr:GNAT family N-acetyltransferase [Cellulomonas sp. HLT2-17]RYV52832.1 N-acetyltransferase [Cellulomonas sp. HLT2-17]